MALSALPVRVACEPPRSACRADVWPGARRSGAAQRCRLDFFAWGNGATGGMTVWCRCLSGPVEVTAVAGVDDGENMGCVAGPVDDAVGAASRAELVI